MLRVNFNRFLRDSKQWITWLIKNEKYLIDSLIGNHFWNEIPGFELILFHQIPDWPYYDFFIVGIDKKRLNLNVLH